MCVLKDYLGGIQTVYYHANRFHSMCVSDNTDLVLFNHVRMPGVNFADGTHTSANIHVIDL